MERIALAVLHVAACPAVIAAQRVTITPLVGAYIPLTDQGPADPGSPYCSPDDPAPCTNLSATYALEPGVLVGLKVSWRAFGLFGIEAEIASAATERQWEVHYGPPDNRTSFANYTATRTTSAALRLSLAHAVTPNVRLGVAGGLSVIGFSGAGYGYEPLRDETVVGSSLAGMMGLTLGRNVAVDFGVQHRAYTIEVSAQSDPLWQQELLLSAGITVGLP